MILSAQSIRSRCYGAQLITPFSERSGWTSRYGQLTYGLSIAGYDVRAEFDSTGEAIIALPPGGFSLASTVERFKMPIDLVGIVCDKSSWARRGLAVQNTVIEPGWEGYLTLELSNHSPAYIYLDPGVPIAQVIFHKTDLEVEFPYQGKYQHQQRGPQSAR